MQGDNGTNSVYFTLDCAAIPQHKHKCVCMRGGVVTVTGHELFNVHAKTCCVSLLSQIPVFQTPE